MPEHTFTFEQIRHQAQENALAYLLAIALARDNQRAVAPG
jgi:hypothetical protein